MIPFHLLHMRNLFLCLRLSAYIAPIKIGVAESFGCKVLGNRMVFVDQASMLDAKNEGHLLDG